MSFEGNGKKPISVGPWGGQGGSSWDDGVYTTVRQLIIVHGSAIDSIKIEYDKKGTSVWSERHGGNGGTRTDKVQLEYPEEVLTSFSGHHSSMISGGPSIVRSLRFESNKRRYGPFGVEVGTHFSFPMTGGKIVGFHGRGGWYLDSIGVYLKHLYEPGLSKALVPSQSLVADKSSYGIVHGSVGNSYDIVVAVREKDDRNKVGLNAFSSQVPASLSREFSDSDPRNKLVALPSNSNRESSINGGPVKYGPWGGIGGSVFDDGTYTGIRQINLTRNAGVASIKVQYDKNGIAIWGNRHGGSGGIRTDKIVFDYPSEILTFITGYYGAVMFMGPTAVRSLTFHTTKGKYGPYGDEQGVFFSPGITEGMVVGFHGRKGWYLDSIGVHVLEGNQSLRSQQPSPSSSFKLSDTKIAEVDNPQWSNKLVLAQKGDGEEVAYGVVKEAVPFGPGPWGGDGGRPWDDGVFSGIKQIVLIRKEAICSIQIEYDRNGQSIWSARHGASGGDGPLRVKLEYPNEVLTCICGYYGPIIRDGSILIKSLTFYTSRGKYGPYGEEVGSFFTSTTTEGKVVGFHGRSGQYLDAIGVHMQHWLGDRKPTKSVLSKIFR